MESAGQDTEAQGKDRDNHTRMHVCLYAWNINRKKNRKRKRKQEGKRKGKRNASTRRMYVRYGLQDGDMVALACTLQGREGKGVAYLFAVELERVEQRREG